MPAMVLCAGFGTRLQPLTNFFPKPLLPVGDRPAFQHILDQLRSHGFGPVALNTHHRADTFEGVVPPDVAVMHEPSILGTAGGVANAASALGPGDVLIWNGDIQVQPDLPALVRAHRDRAAEGVVATLLVVPREDGEGTVGLDVEGNVARLRGERFGTEVAGADYLGVMVLSETARAGLPVEGCLVGDVLMPILREGRRVAVVAHLGGWVDIGTPALFLEANLQWLRSHRQRSWCAPEASVAAPVRLIDSIVAGGAVGGEGMLRECVVLPGGNLSAPSERCIALPDGNFIRVPDA
jgi:mannose-1-phosphate guanylyltransferase